MGAGVGSVSLVPDAKPDEPKPWNLHEDLLPVIGSRRERRHEARTKKRDKLGDRGIHAYGLRKQYPRRLRSTRTYLTEAETFDHRKKHPNWLRDKHRDFKGRADCKPNWRGHRHKLHSSRFRTPRLKVWDEVRRAKRLSQQKMKTPLNEYRPSWEKTGPQQRRIREQLKRLKKAERGIDPDGPGIWWNKEATLNDGVIKCKMCSKIGHDKRDCPRNKPKFPNIRCHHCHQLGHKMEACPKKHPKHPKKPGSVGHQCSKINKKIGKKKQLQSKKERSERAAFAKLLTDQLRKLEGLSEIPSFKVYTAQRNYKRPPEAKLDVALTAPAKLVEELDPDCKFLVIWDSGASCSISNNKDDFVELEESCEHEEISGLAKGLSIEGQGTVLWGVLGTNGKIRVLKLPALYIPDSPQRLLSTTSLCKAYPGEKVILDSQKALLTGRSGDSERIAVIAVVDPRTDLPTCLTFLPKVLKPALLHLNNIISTVHKDNINLTDPEKELLRWHFRLGHLDFRRIQFLMRAGTLAHTGAARSLHTAASKIKQCPKCAACQYGKQCRRPVKGTTTTNVRDQAGATSKTAHLSGQLVAVDHFVSSTRGRRFNTKGKEAEKDRYLGGAIFVDLATGYLFIEFQTNLTTHETLLAKEKFELECRDHGVVVQEYLTDMGSAFTSKAFREHLQEFEQIIRFAGAGGHHHNAQAERAIRTVTSIARTMMFHQAIHWPEVADPANWPMAMRHAVFLANMVPDATTGHSAFDRFTQSRWPKSRLMELHVWGCPAYALDKKLVLGYNR